MIQVPCDKDLKLETNRLCLLPICAADARLLFEILKEPALHSFTGGQPPSTVDELTRKIVAWEKRQSPARDEIWLNWTLRLKGEEIIIGYVQASVRARQVQLAWVIGLPFQRKGYGSEASLKVAHWLVEQFGEIELRANIHPKHMASQAIAERIGLRPTEKLTEDGERVWLSCSTPQ